MTGEDSILDAACLVRYQKPILPRLRWAVMKRILKADAVDYQMSFTTEYRNFEIGGWNVRPILA